MRKNWSGHNGGEGLHFITQAQLLDVARIRLSVGAVAHGHSAGLHQDPVTQRKRKRFSVSCFLRYESMVVMVVTVLYTNSMSLKLKHKHCCLVSKSLDRCCGCCCCGCVYCKWLCKMCCGCVYC